MNKDVKESPVSWGMLKAQGEPGAVVVGHLGQMMMSAWVNQPMTPEGDAGMRDWMCAAEQSLIKISLDHPDYVLDVDWLMGMCVMMAGNRGSGRVARYAGGYLMRPYAYWSDNPIGHLFTVREADGSLRLARVFVDGGEHKMTITKIRSETEIATFLWVAL